MPVNTVILEYNFSHMNVLLIAVISFSLNTSSATAENRFAVNQLPGEVQELTYYYANGSKQQTGLMEDGLKTGEWISYAPDGTITARAYYDHGVKTGKWRIYNKEGVLTYKICYQDGVRQWAQAYNAAGELAAFTYTAEK